MARETTDIFISGGGIAGLTAGIVLARAGFRVTLADPSPPPAEGDAAADLRSTAFLAPARTLLDEAGIWNQLAAQATPLEVLRVIDLAGTPPRIRAERAFRSADLGEPAFGWNLPNWLTRKVLAQAANDTPGLTVKFGAGFDRLLTREAEALVTLSDGTRLSARLAIAADGRASPLRDAAGIDVKTTRYGQKALAFAVTHDEPHHNISTELYHAGGAFVLVPLPDHRGKPASAVVWMQEGAEALRLATLDDAAFGREATKRSAHVLGDLTAITPRRVWPVVTQRATRLTSERTALIAEAAHVLPPIGAQGLNTSLHDVRALVELAREAPETLGTRPFLDRFARAREADIRARAGVIDLYNRVCRSDAPPVQALRSAGLKLVHDLPPLRHGVMRAGMGSR